MGEFDVTPADSVKLERMASAAERTRVGALRRSVSREQMVFRAGQAAAEVSVRRGESRLDREGRVARARAYAAWEWDGKPEGDAHLEEFGVKRLDVTDMDPTKGPMFKRGKDS